MDNMSLFQHDTDALFQKLAAYHLNELGVEERAEVEGWIQANEVNAKQYRAVQQLLQQDPAAVSVIEVDVEKGWQALGVKIAAAQPASHGKVRRLTWYWAAAAVLTGLVIGGWLFFQTGNSTNSQWIAKIGFDTLQLADGTTII